ncbi:DsbA family oxidoreductase [Gorillibacterium sp. sgz5001074]|uniref:DsbA family oxidoreductase n=1 Tax=Gorillibacterium sp. sgz5001074 TaxID=3446695 RepID=UPI003F67DDB4
MRIDIFSDNVCPWCRIGKQNLMEALHLWASPEPVTIRWRSFQLDPSIPAEGRPFRESLEKKFGGAEQMDQIIGHVCKAGEACGTAFAFEKIQVEPNTFLSHQLLKLVPPEKQTEVADALFRANFEEGRNIGDLDVLAAIADEAGLDGAALRKRLAAGEGADGVKEDLEFAQRAGIRSVPYFIFDDKYGLSGAHPVQSFLQAFARLQDEGSSKA